MAKTAYTTVIITRKAAQASGLLFYFTGRPCGRGHISARYVSGAKCIKCGQENSANWISANCEKYKARRKAWHLCHKDHVSRKHHQWYLKNTERAKAKARKWWAAHQEFDRIRSAKWRKENPELAAEVARRWAAKNLDKRAAKQRNRISRQKQVGGTHTADDVALIYKWQRGKCAICRIKLGLKYHVDHIVPLAKSGSNDRTNLQCLCRMCNLKKSDSDPLVYMRAQGGLL